jgi:hypothetical protein
MKPFTLAVLLAVFAVYPSESHATNRSATSRTVRMVAHSSVDVAAHWVGVTNGLSESVCGNAVWLPEGDSEMVAVIVSAQVNNAAVNISYDDDASIVSFPVHGNLRCRLISVYIP